MNTSTYKMKMSLLKSSQHILHEAKSMSPKVPHGHEKRDNDIRKRLGLNASAGPSSLIPGLPIVADMHMGLRRLEAAGMQWIGRRSCGEGARLAEILSLILHVVMWLRRTRLQLLSALLVLSFLLASCRTHIHFLISACTHAQSFVAAQMKNPHNLLPFTCDPMVLMQESCCNAF